MTLIKKTIPTITVALHQSVDLQVTLEGSPSAEISITKVLFGGGTEVGLTEAAVLLAAVDGSQLHRGKILAVQLRPQLAGSEPLPRQGLVLTQLQRWILQCGSVKDRLVMELKPHTVRHSNGNAHQDKEKLP